MDIWSIIFFGIVQGATEFIPVSSSAHLMILPALLKISLPSLFLDISLHFGTFLALLVYFRKQIKHFFRLKGERSNLLKGIIVATIPVVLAGVLFHDFLENLFKKPIWAALFLILNGLLLIVAERLANFKKTELNLSLYEALAIGIAQALAIFPGISRSGATISAGLFIGLSREEAARFSFLLGLPVFFGSFLYELKEVSLDQVSILPFFVAILVSFITGYIVIDFLLKYLRQRSLYIFAFYCLGLGFFSIWWLK